jgi:hypothetical protein
MSGRPKQKRYQYDESGKFIKVYESEADCRKEYYNYSKGKYPFFRKSKEVFSLDYHILPDNTFLFKERVGRDGVRELKKRLTDDFINLKEDKPLIRCLNRDNKVIATFKDIYIANKLTKIPVGIIYHSLNRKSNSGKETIRNITFEYE